MVHRVPCSAAVGRNSRKAFRTIATNASGVKKACLNLLMRCNISVEELGLNIWLIDTNQSQKVETTKPTRCSADDDDATDTASTASDDLEVISIDDFQAMQLDVTHCRERTPQLCDLLKKIANSGLKDDKDEWKPNNKAQQEESAYCCSNNDARDYDVWGFSSDDESNSGSNPWKLVSQCSSSEDSRVELPSLSSSLPLTDSHTDLQVMDQHLSKTNSTSPENRKIDNLEQDWPEDLRATAPSPNRGINNGEVIVISDTESEGREERDTTCASTIAKVINQATGLSSFADVFGDVGILSAASAGTIRGIRAKHPTTVSTPQTGALSALESRRSSKPIAWMKRPYRLHKDSTSIWMSSPIGGKPRKARKSKITSSPPKTTLRVLGMGNNVSKAATGKTPTNSLTKTSNRNVKDVVSGSTSASPTSKKLLRRSPRRSKQINTITSPVSVNRGGDNTMKSFQDGSECEITHAKSEQKHQSNGDTRCVKLRRSSSSQHPQQPAPFDDGDVIRRSPRSVRRVNDHTLKKRELKNLQSEMFSCSSAKLSSSFERQSKIDAIKNIQRCQMETEDQPDGDLRRPQLRRGSVKRYRSGKVSMRNLVEPITYSDTQDPSPLSRSLIDDCVKPSISSEDDIFGTRSPVPERCRGKLETSLSHNTPATKLSSSLLQTGWPATSNLIGAVHKEVTEMHPHEPPADLEVSLNCNNSNSQHLYMSNTSLCSGASSSISLSVLLDDMGRQSDTSDLSSSDENCFSKVKSQLIGSDFQLQTTRRIPEPIVGSVNGINYKFQPVIDGDTDPLLPVLESRGYLKINSVTIPYVVINGFKHIQVAEAVKLFSRCERRCGIPRKVLVQKHLIIASLTFEQVNQLDMVRGEENISASSGDIVIRAKDLLEQRDQIENQIAELHMNKRRKLRCSLNDGS